MHDVVRSRRGVLITKRTIDVLREFLETIKQKGGRTISYAVTRQADGKLYISLGGDYDAPPAAITDEVERIPLYWYAEASEFADLKNHIVDTPGNGPTRLLRGKGDATP